MYKYFVLLIVFIALCIRTKLGRMGKNILTEIVDIIYEYVSNFLLKTSGFAVVTVCIVKHFKLLEILNKNLFNIIHQ